MKFLEYYIGSIIILTVIYLSDKLLLKFKKNYVKKSRVIFSILLFSIFITVVNLIDTNISRGIIRLIMIYAILCLFGKMIFQKNISDTIIVTLIVYLDYVICETIIAILISIILELLNVSSMLVIQNTIFINAIISIMVYIVILFSKEKLYSLITDSQLKDKNSYIIFFAIIFTLTLLLLKLPITKWNFDLEFIFTMLLLLGFSFVGIVLLKQKSDIQKTKSMYQQLVEYSNITNNVLEEYRVVTHEHNNQLLIIRSMLENKDKDINDYVENLLEKREGIKYKWIGELNHLPLSGLKGLINYKVLEMESLKLNKVISISKEVSKLKLEKMSMSEKDNLYSIIGVYLDNAIQAAKESKEKEINIEIYKEKTEMVIIIANTYNGKIEINKLDNYGYTTKGKNHGIGLHIVKNIINNETIFNSKTYILDKYFVQEIRIDLKQIKAK